MVIGIDKFKEFFKEYSDSYIIIGGTARDFIIEDAGFTPIGTEDIDIVLIVEAINPAFGHSFWEFIKLGKYQKTQINTEKRNCYRFCDRQDENFPKQIELFSKNPDSLILPDDAHLTPIPLDEGLSNLSAILLNEDYYNYTRQHSTLKDEIHFANIEAIICLKAFAYLNNKERKEDGQKVRKRDILKHKNDIFRLIRSLKPDDIFELPDTIQKDMRIFAETIKKELPDKSIFNNMNAGIIDMQSLYNKLMKNFNLTSENEQ